MRQVSNLTPMELWAYGPSRHFEAIYGYTIYHLLQSAAFVSSTSVFITIYLKFEAAKSFSPSKSKIFKVIVLLCLPVLASLAMEMTLINRASSEETREQFRQLNENYTDHTIVGIIDFTTVPSRINLYLLSSYVILLPLGSILLRRKILSYLSASLDRNSQWKKSQNQSFVNGLTLQTFLPLICYFPIFILFFFVILTKTEIPLQQFLIFVLPMLPAGLDPYITIYSVTPYRRQFRIWLRIEKSNAMVTVSTSQVLC